MPILSTDVGDIKMMIPDFEHGFIAKIGNVESIANAIEEAVNAGISLSVWKKIPL